ncbi:hypothetical protein PG997_002188 [Apiospora hydei]|uniref:Uncharacterized protein n=1 Tax=Apiospora hydei TaxID=1337664 RepID=A0ABR1X8P9_9PEZI
MVPSIPGPARGFGSQLCEMLSMSSMLELDLHEWCPEFDQVKDHFQGDNQIFIETLASNIDSQTDSITLFTNADDPDQMPNEETETILGFCRTVRSSHAFHETAHEKLVAIVLECDSTGRSRKSCSPMKVAELYETLSAPRFQSTHRIPAEANSQNTPERTTTLDEGGREVSSEAIRSEIPDAERRLVFIVNLDEWVVWALASTASPMQAISIRSFISNHIAFKADLDVNIPSDGPRTFALSFHLPFYVLRDTSKGARFHDPRGLRNSQDVGFMRDSLQPEVGTAPEMGTAPPCEYIYEVGVSCLVTGQNTRFWTAYMFLDDYDEGEEGEILEEYEAQREVLDESCVTLDPFTGRPIAWPLVKPREYFLNVLEVRSRQAGREWRYTVSHLLSYFGGTRDSYVQSIYDYGEEGRSIRKAYFVWINSVIKLLAKLRRSLGECTSAWTSFTSPAGDLCYFHAPKKQWDTAKTHKLQLVNIMKNFKQMSELLRELETVDGELKSTMNELGHHLSYENNESAILQIATAKDVKILTWVTFVTLASFHARGRFHEHTSRDPTTTGDAGNARRLPVRDRGVDLDRARPILRGTIRDDDEERFESTVRLAQAFYTL